MSDGIEGAAASTVEDFNANLNALEQINIGLRKARPGSTNQASLMDERDRLLDKLSSQAGVSATFENNGSVTLRAAGSGDLLVGGGAVNPIAVTAAPDGRLSYSVGGSPLTVTTGSLAGQAEAAEPCRRSARRARYDGHSALPRSSTRRIRRAPMPMAIRARRCSPAPAPRR